MRRHIRWERAGRTLGLPNGDRVYTGALAQRNVELADGSFAPFTWNADARSLKYSDLEARFAGGGVEFWADDVWISSVRPKLQRLGRNGWRDETASVRVERLSDEDDGGPIASARIAITLETYDATARHIIVAGGRRRARADTVVTAHRVGEYRVVLDHDLPGAVRREYRRRDGEISAVGIVTPEGWRAAWTAEEDRAREVTPTPHGFRIGLPSVRRERGTGPDVTITISPDTYGPVSNAGGSDDVNADATGYLVDGDPQTTGGHTGGHFYLDESTAAESAVSWRFASVNLGGAPTSINAGTQLSLQRENDNSGANGTIIFKCQASNAPTTASTGDRPYARTQNATSSSLAYPLNAVTQTPDLSSPIGALVSGGFTYSGGASDAIMITAAASLFGGAVVSWRYIGADVTHTTLTEAVLTVVFTPAGGGGGQVGGDGTGAVVPTARYGPEASDNTQSGTGGTSALSTETFTNSKTAQIVKVEIDRFGSASHGGGADALPAKGGDLIPLLWEARDLTRMWTESMRPNPKGGLIHRAAAQTDPFVFSRFGLPLTGLFNNFGGSPWNGAVTAGPSNTAILSNGLAVVGAGAPLNGYGTASMVEASSDYFTCNQSALSFYGVGASTTNWSGWALVNMATIDAAVSPYYQNGCILCSSGSSSIALFLQNFSGSCVVGLGIFNGTANLDVTTAILLNTWQFVQYKYDGANLWIQVNSTGWQSFPSAAGPTGSGVTFEAGRSPGVEYMNGTIAELGMINTTLSDATFALVKGDVAQYYGLSL